MNRYLVIRNLNQLSNNLQMYLGSINHYYISYHHAPEIIPAMRDFDPEIRRYRNKCLTNADSVNSTFKRLPLNIRHQYFRRNIFLVNESPIFSQSRIRAYMRIIQKLILKLKYKK